MGRMSGSLLLKSCFTETRKKSESSLHVDVRMTIVFFLLGTTRYKFVVKKEERKKERLKPLIQDSSSSSSSCEKRYKTKLLINISRKIIIIIFLFEPIYKSFGGIFILLFSLSLMIRENYYTDEILWNIHNVREIMECGINAMLNIF